MRKRKILVISILLIIVYNLYVNFSYKQLLPIKKLPNKYKSYNYAREGVVTEKHVLKEFLGSEEFEDIDIEYFNEKDTTVIIKTKNYAAHTLKKTKVYRNIFYKLDRNGTIKDSLVLVNEFTKLYSGYLISKDSFYTWILDGNKHKKKCKLINRDDTLTKEAASKKLIELYTKAELTGSYYDIYYENIRFSTSLFLINKEWNILFGKTQLDYTNREKYPNKIKERTKLENIVKEESVWNGTNADIQLLHFQKKKFEKARRNSLFNPIHHTSYDKWLGNGYMHLLFKGDTIPFKMLLNYELGSSNTYKIPFRGELEYYTKTTLNFGLLRYHKDHLSRLYIVKNRENKIK